MRVIDFLRRLSMSSDPYHQGRQIQEIAVFLASFHPNAVIVDIGAGPVRRGERVFGIDKTAGPEIDIVADAALLPFRETSVDGILSTGALKHMRGPRKAIAEMHRVLKPGGRAYVAVPFLQGFRAETDSEESYRRWTLRGLELDLSCFRRTASGPVAGAGSSLARQLREMIPLFFFSCPSLAYSVTYRIAGWLTFWLRALDLLFLSRDLAHRTACGVSFHGTKM